MQLLLKSNSIKQQLFFSHNVLRTLKKSILKPKTEITANKNIGCCISIKFLPNNIYCTF